MPKVELIAEVSSNHGGDLELAKAFIHQYAEAGADWVKFQSYQVRTLRPGDPQREWLAQAELTDDAHHLLKAECETAGVQFLTTVFHHSRMAFLGKELGLRAVKIGAGEFATSSVYYTAAQYFPRVIRSAHIRSRVGWADPFEHDKGGQVLACVSRYPASTDACAIAMRTIGYYNIVGWSDHFVGNAMCHRAMEVGARIIEKHVSLPAQKRERRAFEATLEDFRELRAFADDDPSQFIGRWQFNGD